MGAASAAGNELHATDGPLYHLQCVFDRSFLDTCIWFDDTYPEPLDPLYEPPEPRWWHGGKPQRWVDRLDELIELAKKQVSDLMIVLRDAIL